MSAVTGKVREVGYDPILYGNYLLIHGQGEHRTYMYAHMKNPPSVHQGERVWAGERVGEVGKTGNARTVGCQLHIEIHVNGVPIDPKPEVERWDAETLSAARLAWFETSLWPKFLTTQRPARLG